MDKNDLKNWRKMVMLSQPKAAEVLGFGVRQYKNMERGIADIRECIPLACAAYALGIREYDGPSLQAAIDRQRKGKNDI